MTTSAPLRLSGLVLSALLAVSAAAGCGDANQPLRTRAAPPATSVPFPPARCAGERRRAWARALAASSVAGPRRRRRPVSPSRRFRQTTARRSPRPWRRRRSAAVRCRVLSDGHTAVAADPDRDRVYIVDLAPAGCVRRSRSIRATSPAASSRTRRARPRRASPRRRARHASTPCTASCCSGAPSAPAPRGIAYDRATRPGHVACAGGELVSLPAGGGDAVRTVTA